MTAAEGTGGAAGNVTRAGAADRELVRAIGPRQLAASVVNSTVGAGIFVLPALVAAEIGRAAPVAYVVCAAAMGLVVSCFAAAGSRVTLTGGLYAYTETAFGPFIGFLAGVLYWLAASFSVASVASALTGTIAVSFPVAGAGPGRAVLLVLLFGTLAFVNIRGVVSGIRVVEIGTAAKLVPLVLFIAAGVAFVPLETLIARPPLPASADVGRAAVILMFAFIGLEVALVPSGEIRDCARTVPRALFTALIVTTGLYLLIQAVAQGVLGEALAGQAAAPLAEAASRLFGSVGRTLVLAGGAVSMFGYVSGDMLGTPRSLFAFGRDGLLPRAVAAVHPRFRTPWIAILVHGTIVTALAITGTFGQLAVIANVATLSLYLMCVGASYELQRRDVRGDGSPFVLPLGPVIPLLAGLVLVWLISHATASELAVTAAVVAAASVGYIARQRNGRA